MVSERSSRRVSLEDQRIFGKFNLVEEQMKVVRSELSLGNLDYPILARKLIARAWPFYCCVVLFQLFAAFPRHTEVSAGPGGSHTPLPHQAVWLHVPPGRAFASDADALGEALQLLNGTGCPSCSTGWDGECWESEAFLRPLEAYHGEGEEGLGGESDGP